MGKAFRTRRFLALLAAYVVGLQALLLPLSVAGGGFAGETLCLSAAGGASQPTSQDSPCPCAAGCGMQCGAHALAVPPPSELALVSAAAGVLASPIAIDAPFQRAGRDAHTPRAPPAA